MKRNADIAHFFTQAPLSPKRQKESFCKPSDPLDVDIRHSFEQLDMSTVTEDIIFVQANAGGGKTHSVIEFIKHHKDMNLLVISHTNTAVNLIRKRLKCAFSDANIPANIDIRTNDSLAWHNARALLAPTTRFHSNGGQKYTNIVRTNARKNNMKVFEYLKTQSEIQSSHALNHSILTERYVLKKYDIVLIDEAQDLSPTALDFFKFCTEVARHKIFIGDEKQSIYYPRCIFAQDVRAARFSFTHTFRYDGESLIRFINQYMSDDSTHTASMKNHTNLYTKVTFDAFAKVGQTTVLVTTWKNILSYDCANMYIDRKHKEKIRQQVSMHREYNKRKKEYTYKRLRQTDLPMTFDEWMISKKWASLLDYSEPKWEAVHDALLQNDKNNPDKNTAHHICTVHQMKGEETENVYVDVSCIPYENTSPATVTIKENLFYVALTRATKNVGLSKLYHPYQFSHWYEQHRQEIGRYIHDPKAGIDLTTLPPYLNGYKKLVYELFGKRRIR